MRWGLRALLLNRDETALNPSCCKTFWQPEGAHHYASTLLWNNSTPRDPNVTRASFFTVDYKERSRKANVSYTQESLHGYVCVWREGTKRWQQPSPSPWEAGR